MTARQAGPRLRQAIARTIVIRGWRILWLLAHVWRRLLFRTTFVAITGSLGKTTAKECVAACLATRFPTAHASGNQNAYGRLALAMLRVRPWHRYAVFEVEAGTPGRIARRIAVVRPHVAIVLCIARTHTTAYPSLEAVAAEKARLIHALRPGGLAVLYADDPRLAALAPPAGCAVRRFDTVAAADVRGEPIPTRWPERFSLRVSCAGETQLVQTQLVGEHWMPAVLAALTVATHAGVPLGEAAAALRGMPPLPGRMQPVRVPSGAIVLRDDYSGSVDTLEPALRVIAGAVGTRRIVLVTDFSDFGKSRLHRLRHLAPIVARSADVAVFTGERAAYLGRRAVEAGMAPERVYHFGTLEEAARFLRSELGPGDLLLLKGRTTDHATRVFHALLGPIQCWKPKCRIRTSCDQCWQLGARRADSRRALPVLPPSPERTFTPS